MDFCSPHQTTCFNLVYGLDFFKNTATEVFKVLGALLITAEVVQGIDGKCLAPTKSPPDCKNAVTSSAGIRNMFPSLLLSIYFFFESFIIRNQSCSKWKLATPETPHVAMEAFM